MPIVQAMIGAACTGWMVDVDMAGDAPGHVAPFLTVGGLMVTSVGAFGAAMGQFGTETLGDLRTTPVPKR